MSGKAPYPTSGYPQQGYPSPGYPQQQYAPQPGYSTSYYAQPAPGVTVYGQAYQSPGAYASPPQGPPPPYSYMPPEQSQYPPQQGIPQPIVVNNVFDSGCRFDGIAQPHIPPPPPGVAPNAAQLAMMQGHPVIGTQQQSNFWTGGTGGGYTWGGL